jgi:hypothetical protein
MMKIYPSKETDKKGYRNWDVLVPTLLFLEIYFIYNNKKITIVKLFADGAYDGNDIFRYLGDNGILPCIKVRKRMLEFD